MKYLLAVDGGGTKTEFCISNLDGKMMQSFCTGGSNYKTVGEKQTYLNLSEGIKRIQEEFSIAVEDIAYSVFGISGCDVKEDYDIMWSMIEKLGFVRTHTHLCNDGVLGFFAQAVAPGLVIVAGTGSIIIGVDASGHSIRKGGWGENISDIGSGYWIGNEALIKTLLYCDGVFPYSKLFDAIKDKLEAKDFVELPYHILEIKESFRIATYAKEVIQMAQEGDKLCLDILEEGAEVLANLAKSAFEKLQLEREKEIAIVLSGGLFNNELYTNLIQERVKKKIAFDKITFFHQKNRPVYGGICLAKQRMEL